MTLHIWLDDERLPGSLPAYRRPPYRDLAWTWVKTVPDALATIEAAGGGAAIGFMALDHDLGWCTACQRAYARLSPRDQLAQTQRCEHVGTGVTFLQALDQRGWWPTIKPVVHSFNPDGAARMRALIDAAYGGHR
jgi:hypothetical protein